MSLALASCSGDTEQGPLGTWHQLEGGPIAAARPPAPGLALPYPKLSTVPPLPKPVTPAERARTFAKLARDRANATYETKLDPIAEAGAKRGDDGLFAPATPAPVSPDAAGASLPAASPAAAPAPAAQPRRVQSGQSSPASESGLHSVVDQPIPDIAEDQTPPPPIPAAPPAAPHIADFAVPVTVAHLPPVAPPVPVVTAALQPAERAPVTLGFIAGSAVPTVADRADLDALAARRGAHRIEIIGFGEAAEEDGHSQVAGVALGLARAEAAAAILQGDGVPASAITLAARAAGTGGAARLTE